MTRQVTTVKFKGQTLKVSMARTYETTENIAIELFDKSGMPYMKATVNLPDVFLEHGYALIKNDQENTGIMQALRDAYIIGDTVASINYGHGQRAFLVPVTA